MKCRKGASSVGDPQIPVSVSLDHLAIHGLPVPQLHPSKASSRCHGLPALGSSVLKSETPIGVSCISGATCLRAAAGSLGSCQGWGHHPSPRREAMCDQGSSPPILQVPVTLTHSETPASQPHPGPGPGPDPAAPPGPDAQSTVCFGHPWPCRGTQQKSCPTAGSSRGFRFWALGTLGCCVPSSDFLNEGNFHPVFL